MVQKRREGEACEREGNEGCKEEDAKRAEQGCNAAFVFLLQALSVSGTVSPSASARRCSSWGGVTCPPSARSAVRLATNTATGPGIVGTSGPPGGEDFSSGDSTVKIRRVSGRPHSTKQIPSSRGGHRACLSTMGVPTPVGLVPGVLVKLLRWCEGLPGRGQDLPGHGVQRPANEHSKKREAEASLVLSFFTHSGSRGVGGPALGA